MPSFKYNPCINVDRVRAVEIHDATPEFQPINLESESYHNNKIRPLRFNSSTKPQSNKLHESKRQISRDKIHSTGKIQEIEGKHEQREIIKPFKDFRQKVHKLLNHFICISSCNSKNKISSEKIFNLFQERKFLQKKMEREASLAKFLFEISYTNYLSFLHHTIGLKQRRYDIYSESEELDKVLSLIDEEIEEMTQTYLDEEEKKIDFIFTQELLGQTYKIAKRASSRQNSKVEQNLEQIILENDEKHENLRKSNETQPEKTNQLLEQRNQVVLSQNLMIQNEEPKCRIAFNSESESVLEDGQILPRNKRIEEYQNTGSGHLISFMEQRQLSKGDEFMSFRKINEAQNHKSQ